SGVIVAGAVFTIPGLYILQAKYPEIEVDFWQIFFSSLLGGFLGILFLIPFRKYFVKDMHGKLPFPEATATTEILMICFQTLERRDYHPDCSYWCSAG
ncbi:MAG: family oligopeptide transporter, partial [Bacteroidetes bacterium]|nr:family oligopeptide transporter [Bacteroidota bacterium]